MKVYSFDQSFSMFLLSEFTEKVYTFTWGLKNAIGIIELLFIFSNMWCIMVTLKGNSILGN